MNVRAAKRGVKVIARKVLEWLYYMDTSPTEILLLEVQAVRRELAALQRQSRPADHKLPHEDVAA